MKSLARYLKFFIKEVTVGPALKLTEAVFELIVPLVTASIIDVGIANRDASYCLKMGGAMIALGVFGLLFSLTCQYFAAKAYQGVGTKLRLDLYSHIMRLSQAQTEALGKGTLINRVNSDVNQVQMAVAMLIRLAIRAPFLVVGATIMSAIISPKLSLIFLAAAILLSVTLYFVMSRAIPRYKKVQGKLDGITTVTRENLDGARVVRSFNQTAFEQRRFDEQNTHYTKSNVEVGKINALLDPLAFVIMNTAVIAILWLGGKTVNAGGLTQGQLIALINYLAQMLLATSVVANLVVIFTRSAASAGRINEIFALKPSISFGEKNITKNEYAIEFEHASFSYANNGENELQDISIQIATEQRVGIIGGTGSGKSTLVKLLNRTYDLTEGKLKLFGQDIENISKAAVKNAVSVVAQNAQVFSGTVKSNLLIAKEDATDEQMRRALSLAQADFISSLEMEIAQGGKNISGGQRQRLTIARALLKDAPVYIFDDATSALDAATDAKLRRALKENFSGKTMITVSQRVTAVMDSDLILVLDEGVLIDAGTHEQLKKRCKIYADICALQLGGAQ